MAAFIAAVISTWARHEVIEGVNPSLWARYIPPALIAGVLVPLCLSRVPEKRGTLFLSKHLLRLAKGVVLATLLLAFLSFFYRGEEYSRGAMLIFIPTSLLLVWFAGRFHIWLLDRIRANEQAASRVVVVGMGSQGIRLAAELEASPATQKVVGYLDTTANPDARSLERLGTPSDLATVIREHGVSMVVITSDRLGAAQIEDAIGVAMAEGAKWMLVPQIHGMVLDRLSFEVVNGIPVVSERGGRIVGHHWYLKRAFDIVGAGIALILSSPLFLLAAVATRLSSRGPVIYRQERIGMNGRPFTLYKFRTMRVDCDTSTHEQYVARWITGKTGEAAAGNGAVHKMTDDKRVTRVGRILRATSIDELPQLWNILKGDMSLVGPRPPIEYEVARYTDWHRRRLAVPPGVTGPWQVSGRNRLSFEDMVRLDIAYIESWSLGLDVKILLRTVPALFAHRGS